MDVRVAGHQVDTGESLRAHAQRRVAEITEKWRRVGEEATAIQVKPRKADVRVTHFGLAWAPHWRTAGADGRATLTPAYR